MSSTNIDVFPAELVIEIFKFLPYLDRFVLERTCKQFKNSLESCEYFWKKTYEQFMYIPKGLVPLSGKSPMYWKEKVVECLKPPTFVPLIGSVLSHGDRVFSTKTRRMGRHCVSEKEFSRGKHIIAFRSGTNDQKNIEKNLHSQEEKRTFVFTLGLTPALHPEKMKYGITIYGCGTSFEFETSGKWRTDTTQNVMIKYGDHASSRYKYNLMSYDEREQRPKIFEEVKLPFGKLIFMYFDLDERLLAFFLDKHLLTVCQPFFDDIGAHQLRYDKKHHAEVLKEPYHTQNPKKFYLAADMTNCYKPAGNFVQILDYERVPFGFDREKVVEYLVKHSIPRISEKVRKIDENYTFFVASGNQNIHKQKGKKKKKKKKRRNKRR